MIKVINEFKYEPKLEEIDLPEAKKKGQLFEMKEREFIVYENGKEELKWREVIQKPTAESYYSQFNDTGEDRIIEFDREEMEIKLNECAKILKENNILLFFVGWPLVWNFIDNAEDDIQEQYFDDNLFNDQEDWKCCYLFFTDNAIFQSSCIDGNLNLQHRIPKNSKKEYIEIIMETFTKVFGKSRFEWNGKDSQCLTLKMLSL